MQRGVLLHRAGLVVETVALIALLAAPAAAVPHFSRQYEVSCGMCHITVPKLNETGEKFFANGYRFPGFAPASPGTLPLSALGQVRYENFISNDADRTHFREVELIVAGPLGEKGGSYFVEWLPFNNQFKSNGTTSNRSGRFEDIVVTVPVGHNGSLALGQFRAASQVDVSRRLSISTPLAFGAKTGSFAISSRSPGFGYSYFQPDKPGDVVNGWTHNIVVPFPGEVTLNNDFSFRSRPEGVFLESYKREGLSSTGGYLFLGQGGVLGGVVGVLERGKVFSTLNIGFATRDDDIRVSFENEYLDSEHFAVGVRFERQGGAANRTAGVFWVDVDTPTTMHTTRWRAEYRVGKGDRQQFTMQLDALF